MTRNMNDLVDMLFDQLEAVQTTKVDDIDRVESICELTKAVNATAHNIIKAGELCVSAAKLDMRVNGGSNVQMPAMLSGGDDA